MAAEAAVADAGCPIAVVAQHRHRDDWSKVLGLLAAAAVSKVAATATAASASEAATTIVRPRR